MEEGFLREKLVIEANYEKGLFVWRPPVIFLNKDPNYPVCLLASREGTGEQQLWHLRMGHLNYADMDKLKYMSLNMEYAKGTKHGMCVACCRGKMHSRPHKGNNEKASKAFEVIYADVWGPLSNSLQGHKYAVLLVDEATSYSWVNFTATKSQVGEVITSFIVHQERRANFIQTLRTDNGGEFTSMNFKQFLWERDIRHATSPPYTPQY